MEKVDIIRWEDGKEKIKNNMKIFLTYIKGKWNSLLYWLMIKNYKCHKCLNKDCNCK
jgi:hypothetical protein